MRWGYNHLMQLVINSKAKHEYEILTTYQAGVVLTGPEVKSLRSKQASLKGSHVKVVGDEAFLLGAQITPYQYADTTKYDPKRTRKLLLKKKEIFQLKEASAQKGRTLVPLAFELERNKIKLSFGIARGKKQHEKRSELRKRALKRDVERETKQKLRA